MSSFKSKHLVKDVPFVSCPYCEESEKNRFKMIHHSHLPRHGKTLEDVRKEFPDLPTMTLQECNKKKALSKMGGEKLKENLLSGKTKHVKCYYHMDDDCPGKDFEVALTDPSYVLCFSCKSAGKENPDGRTKIDSQIKREDHFMKTYGVKNPQQIPEVKQKTNQTLERKYGGIGLASKELSEKAQNTCLDLYGVKNYMSKK